jgi:hypothetical protein
VNRPARERWTIRIEPLPCEVPAPNRIRSALKVLLRRFGLRCTAILDGPPAQAASGAAGAEPAGGPSPKERP